MGETITLTAADGHGFGAYRALARHGDAAQKALYLPKLATGTWSGTMCLTEPHCGTDLGLIKTRAEPAADGSYRIAGTKIFISAGDHDLTEAVMRGIEWADHEDGLDAYAMRMMRVEFGPTTANKAIDLLMPWAA